LEEGPVPKKLNIVLVAVSIIQENIDNPERLLTSIETILDGLRKLEELIFLRKILKFE